MNIPSQADPRANQKARTRAALVEAGTQMLRGGATPTVAEVADLARISRATAYRYFPTQEALLTEIANISPAVAPVEARIARLNSDEPGERLRVLLDTLNRVVIDEEVSMRTGLRIYLDTWLAGRRRAEAPDAVREGRRLRWLDEVLAPVRADLTPAAWRRLRAALALTLGADAIVVMKDVCRLDNDEALSVLQWAAAALLRSALDAPPPGRSAAPRTGKSAKPRRGATAG
jgi:AcrR family transcriptional regulator